MQQALQIMGETWPHPNPRVGAVVITRDGTVAAARAHAGPGSLHAEAAALAAAGARAAGGTVVVTLEPCNHHGRTPPCTEAIIDAGVARVVVGTVDPDRRVDGSGIERLRAAGVEVIADVAVDEVTAADPGYFHHRRTGRPRVVAKLAATLDGQLAAADGTSRWITGPEARLDGHRLRSLADAVAIGAGTLIDDDPELTVRLDGYTGPQPRPVVVAGRRALPPERLLYARSPLVYSPIPRTLTAPAEVIEVSGGDRVDLSSMMKDLGSRGILDLLIEGGSTLAAAMATADLVDVYEIYLAARFGLGVGRPMFDRVFDTLDDSRALEIEAVTMVGADIRVRAVPAGRMG